ncbi:Bug family tripartite tricarboxylate transporter substrate binding protein [Comamonas testosteroni]|uniref:MFS transporter n=1 Tax=Comamonas testosteroni TaxID=285 RepID=A0A096GS59_COMTE|nr:tripartite tricarboxylate transporter substrate binding protein [Comamonas testosteroni]KGH28010.1 MFS transporter [Comamonas testosteroni]
MKQSLIRIALCGAALLPITMPGAAQTPYPNKLINIVVPFPAAGTTDSIARIVGDKLRTRVHQSVIIDNKPGAGGNIGAAAVARAAPDGYTLFASPPGPLTINFNLYKNISYDARKFVPITTIANMPNVLVVGPSVKARTLQELIDYARANPGKLSFASQGNGTTSHLTTLYLENQLGIKMVHVPYRGSAPALSDLMAGTVDLMFDNLTTTLPFHQSKRVRILASATKERVATIADVPTMHEAGVRNFESSTWVTLAAPAGTPATVVQMLAREVSDIVKMPDVISQFATLGADPVGSTPEATAAMLREETARWKTVINAAQITLD